MDGWVGGWPTGEGAPEDTTMCLSVCVCVVVSASAPHLILKGSGECRPRADFGYTCHLPLMTRRGLAVYCTPA